MTGDQIVLDDFVFFVLEDQVAIGIDNISVDAQHVIYDGKNTLLLQTDQSKNYVLQNIVPEVRNILKNQTVITIILTQNHQFAEAYETHITTDQNLSFEDTFFNEAENLYQHFLPKA